jgi:hypothetical protein
MCRFITRVDLCIQEGGGHLKTLYTKSETMQKQFNHNSKLCVLKLILITFSKILFVFIISPSFLPHPVKESF